MQLTRIAVARPLFITMAFLAVIVFGVVAYTRLNVDLLPKVDFPVVTVVTIYPGAGPEAVESLITVPIEDALAGISDLDYMQSTSVEGASNVILVFKETANTDQAATDVERKVSAIRGALPTDARQPSVLKLDIASQPVMNLSLAGSRSIEELTRVADERIVTRLNTVPGVGSVSVVGARTREIQVKIDPDKLRAYNLSILQVNSALAAENVNVPSGQIDEGTGEFSVRLNALARTPAELRNVVIASGPTGTIYLRDIADVRDTIVKRTQVNRYRGADSIGILVTKQATANAITVSEGVKKELTTVREVLPSDVKLDVIVDTSDYTRASIQGVQDELIQAIILVGIVLFFFLHTFRSTIIVLLSIPTSLIATFIVMQFLGFTLNIMSLLALTLTIGILIDDSIVVLENIFRHLEKGESPLQAAINGRSEIGLAAIAITLVDVVVFAPVGLLSGITGGFFREFGITVVAATLFSLLVSFTLTPMLASRWLRAPNPLDRSVLAVIGNTWERGYQAIARGYRGLLRVSLRVRGLVVLLGLATFAGAIMLVVTNVVGSEFVPESDQGTFTIVAEMPPGTSLDVTDKAVSQVEQRILTWPETTSTFTSIGVSADMRPAQSRFGRVVVRFVPLAQRQKGINQLAEQARTLNEGIPDLNVRIQTPSMAGSGAGAVQYQVRGDSNAEISRLAGEVQAALASVPGTRDIRNSDAEGQPEVVVRLDRARAADLGITAAQAASAVRTAISGSVVTQYRPPEGKSVDVRVMFDGADLTRVEQIRTIPLTTSKGTVVQLGQIATIERATTAPQIERRDRQRQVTVSANVEGRAPGDVTRDAEALVQKIQLPPGYVVKLAGSAQEQAQSFGQLFMALALSILLTYMVTVALYESLLLPFVVLTALPLASAGAIGALALTGQRLSLISLIGFIMLAGLVGKAAILLVDYTQQLRRRGMSRDEALLEAAPIRLRPIVMTTTALIIALTPVALGVGDGAELRQPIAIPVIGGMLTSTLLTLVFIPSVYTIVDDVQMWALRMLKRGRRAERRVDGHADGAAGRALGEIVVIADEAESGARR